MNTSQPLMLTALVAMAAMFTLPGAVPSAKAQEAGPSLEEIVVTARKRDESQLDIPIAVSVLSSDDIAFKGIAELPDVVDFSPGFHYGGPTAGGNNRGTRRLIMRGMQVSTDAQTRQGATMFVDGAQVLGSEVGSFMDVERIEVVKGPQSAYFGRATFAGAINVITRNPGNEWRGTLKGEAGSYGKSDFGSSIEGPLVADKLSFRFSGSQYGNDGQYLNSANPTEHLGATKTTDGALTLYATPSERFTAKLRLHYWEDNDGPGADLAYGRDNGEDVFNCNLGGTNTGVPAGGPNNYVCGTPRAPSGSEIGVDTIVNDRVRQAISQMFIDGFGFERHAYETSLGLDYQFENGWTLSSMTAAHSSESASLRDLDGRTDVLCQDAAGCGSGQFALGEPLASVFLASQNEVEDFSQDISLSSSAEQRLRWTVGLNYSEIESRGVVPTTLSAFPSPFGLTADKVETLGIFGSLGYDITDQVTLSVEGRSQDDDVTNINFGNGVTIEGTFSSFTPRIIFDYKPNEDMTLYASYAEGTRPGEFNAVLVGVPPEVLACIAMETEGSALNVPEEDLENLELGFKGRLWDGRAVVTVALYKSEWRNQRDRGLAPCENPPGSGNVQFFATTGTGGGTDLQGIEVEFAFAATDNITLEGTYAYNDSEILARSCADCGRITGDLNGAVGNEFSRSPKSSGSLSASYQGTLSGRTDWFARADYIYRGNQWATDQNVASTGSMGRLNLRVGIQTESLRVEVYGTNITDDKTFNGYQRLTDWGFNFGGSVLTAGLPPKPVYGVRATYEFGLD